MSKGYNDEGRSVLNEAKHSRKINVSWKLVLYDLVCFLASDEASYIAGQNIQIDGCRKTM